MVLRKLKVSKHGQEIIVKLLFGPAPRDRAMVAVDIGYSEPYYLRHGLLTEDCLLSEKKAYLVIS